MKKLRLQRYRIRELERDGPRLGPGQSSAHWPKWVECPFQDCLWGEMDQRPSLIRPESHTHSFLNLAEDREWWISRRQSGYSYPKKVGK